MRQKVKNIKEKISISASLVFLITAAAAALSEYMTAATVSAALSVIFLVVCYSFRKVRIYQLWDRVLRITCRNMVFTSSSFGLKKSVGIILEALCGLEGIEAAWVLRRDNDGFFRVYSIRGAVNHDDPGISDINEYVLGSEKSGSVSDPVLTERIPEPVSFPLRLKSILHIPLAEGELLTGLVSFAAFNKRVFKRVGIERFLTVAGVIEQLYENASKREELEHKAARSRTEVDSASDELTKTNLRLINRVKELKSLYDLSVRIFTAQNEKSAAEEVFSQARKVIKADEVAYFKLTEDNFIYAYSTFDELVGKNARPALPAAFLSHNRGIIISDVSDVSELSGYCRRLKLSQLIIVPAKVGDEIQGILVAGARNHGRFTGSEQEVLSMYSSRLAEYLERRRLTDRIMRDNAYLKELNEVKDKFIALISHELRTPLTNLKGFTEMLLRDTSGNLNSEQTGHLESIMGSCNKLENTVNNIIALSDLKRERVKLTLSKTDWNRVIAKACKAFSGEFSEKGIDLNFSGDDKVKNVYVDSERVLTAFNHLLSNALKFTRPGGVVSISTRDCGDYYETVVKDSGIGIDNSMRGRVFEKFKQLEDPMTRSFEGLGVGLALVKEIIESHGGGISIESQPGLGTAVTVVLPYSKGTVPE